MTRKIITGVVAAILLVTIAVFAAEKAKGKASAEKPAPKACEQQGQHEGLLDQLAEAYKANDRQKMGEIINKMQERREEMQEFAKLNRWHQLAHRRMMGQGQQMASQGWNQCCAMRGLCGNCGCAMQGQGRNQCCQMAGPHWGQCQAMRGHGFGGCNNMMGNCGAMAGGFGQMPCQQGGMGMGDCCHSKTAPDKCPAADAVSRKIGARTGRRRYGTTRMEYASP